MKIEVDKAQLWKRIEWSRKVCPDATHITIGTEVDEVVIQSGEAPSFHTAMILADVIEDGAISVSLADMKELYGLKGSTVQISVNDSYSLVTMETENGSLDVPCQRAMLRLTPQVEEVGTLSLKLLKASLGALKESVGRKSEKGTENLLEASTRVSDTSMVVLASNRLCAWTAVLPLSDAEPFDSFSSRMQIATWTATVSILNDDVKLIRTPSAFGVRDDSTISMFPIEPVNDADKLNDVFALMREEFSYTEPIRFEKKKLMDPMVTLNRSNALARIEFLPDGKLKVSSHHYPTQEENARAVSFSIDYTGNAPIESLIISPGNFLKTLKGIQTKNADMYLLEDSKYPVGLVDEGADVTQESLGLTMTINQPQG